MSSSSSIKNKQKNNNKTTRNQIELYKLPYLSVICYTWLLLFPIAAETMLIGNGTGDSKVGAIVNARLDAMHKYLGEKMEESIFAKHQKDIVILLEKNWKEYFVKDGKEERTGARSLQLEVYIDEARLLRDVMNLPAIRLQQKIQGMNIAVVLDPDRESSSFEDSQLLLGAISQNLDEHFTITDAKDAKKLLAQEIKEFGLEGERNYQGNMWREYDIVRIMMYFSIHVDKVTNTDFGTSFYSVTITAKSLQRMTGQQLFRFSHNLTGQNKDKVITQASLEVAQKIIAKMAFSDTILPENEYELKFVLFTDQKDRQNIYSALKNLKQKKYLDILPGGVRAGENYFLERIKWLRQHHSQIEIITIVSEYCLLEQVKVVCHKHNPRTVVFQPPGSNWDGGAENDTTTTLEKYIVAESNFDMYLETDTLVTSKAKNLLKVSFRWRQDAPESWYFYSIYFSNKEVIYIFYPNFYEKNKLLENDKTYTFPDQNDYLEDWGIAFKLALPSGFDKDTDQLLLLATSKPIDILQKKTAKLNEGQIATLSWNEIPAFVEELNQCQYAHKLIDIIID